ncbi:MAG: recombinase family protein [Gemmatimonadota bacterium]|nr:recombinase family protein [Gemmatimonadota bacterium]
MIRAALYARVSTEMQEKEQTIQSQLSAIARYAEANRFHTTPALTYLDEGYSGSHVDRPALDALRDHAREGRFDVVVVLCPDRLARKYAYQVLLIEELKRARIEVHFCERPITDSPDDQLLLQIQGAIAEYERTKILERARRGRLHRARLGELTPAAPPYGYRRVPKRTGGDGQIRIHDEEAALVRQVFAWYAEEGVTLYQLLLRLNASAWKTRAGRKEWAATTVLRMLRCEWYLGRAYYNRTKSTLNPRPGVELPSKKLARYTVTERPPTEWIAVAVPPLIEEPLYQRVQQRLIENRRFARRRLTHDGVFLLKGLLKCGLCGHAYIGESRVEPRRDGGEYAYHFYVCSMRMAPLPGAVRSRCVNDRLRVTGVNDAAWTAVRDLLLDSETVARELGAWVAQATSHPLEADGRAQRTAARLDDLTRQRDRLTDAYQFGALALEVFKARGTAIDDARRAAEQELDDLKAAHLQAEVTRNRARGAEDVVQTLRPRLFTADFDTRQTILRLLVERVVVTHQRLEIHLAIPVSGNFGLTSGDHGERHAYYINAAAPGGAQPRMVFIVDGKPAGYSGGAPQFTADGKSLFTQVPAPGGAGVDVLMDGKPVMRVQQQVHLHMAPAGSLVIGVVMQGSGATAVSYLTAGNKKVPGSECTQGAHYTRVDFSDDGNHFAAPCQAHTRAFVIADGKKGQEYERIMSGIFFTADGRPVYQAQSGGKQFVIAGDQESDAYQAIHGNTPNLHGPMSGAERAGIPAEIRGNRVGFVASSAPNSYVVVVDGKAAPMAYAGELGFSPDGSRYAHVASAGGAQEHQLVLDGVTQKGMAFAQAPRQLWERRYVFSPNGKHVAYAAHNPRFPGSQGVAVDGKLMRLPDAHSVYNFTFTPDSEHLIWVSRSGRAARHLIHVDGEVALDLPSNLELEQGPGPQWSMGKDGVLTFIAQDGDKIKRYRVTPGTSTSVQAMVGAGGRSAPAQASAPSQKAQPANPAAPANPSAPPATPSKLATISSTLSTSSTQDHWSRIKPGETSRDLIQEVLGPATEQKKSFDGEYSIWRSKLEANEIWLLFSGDDVVTEMIVIPSRQLKEEQITDYFGASKQRLSSNDDGSFVVAYPVGLATVEYAQTGIASRITVGVEAMKRAQSAALKAKASDAIKGLFGKKKKP